MTAPPGTWGNALAGSSDRSQPSLPPVARATRAQLGTPLFASTQRGSGSGVSYREERPPMAAPKVADYLLERLRAWGVDKVFAYPGDGINGILAAFGRADNDPKFVQARHEEMAAFEATGYAKFTGRVGVCMATSGPGAIHLLNGLYDAKLDHVPVVAIVGQTSRSAMGGSYQQEVDLL